MELVSYFLIICSYEARLGGAVNSGTCKIYQRNMAKIGWEERNFESFQEAFSVQILRYLCILACRVLNSVLGLHDSIKLG